MLIACRDCQSDGRCFIDRLPFAFPLALALCLLLCPWYQARDVRQCVEEWAKTWDEAAYMFAQRPFSNGNDRRPVVRLKEASLWTERAVTEASLWTKQAVTEASLQTCGVVRVAVHGSGTRR